MGKRNINVQGKTITLYSRKEDDYVSLTDIARTKTDRMGSMIQNWLRNRNTIEFLGLWEELHNDNFKLIEFDEFKKNAGLNSFMPSVQDWIKRTDAIGIESKSGRYGGTYAHVDIAFHFCNWMDIRFYLYFIKDYIHLKTEEAKQLDREWDVRRIIAKTNYHIHAEAVRENLVPIIDWNTKREAVYHASEADLLNLALFGMTAKEWKLINPELKGNMRDHATVEQLLILANLEVLNAEYIQLNVKREERLRRMNEIARRQMDILLGTKVIQELPDGNTKKLK